MHLLLGLWLRVCREEVIFILLDFRLRDKLLHRLKLLLSQLDSPNNQSSIELFLLCDHFNFILLSLVVGRESDWRVSYTISPGVLLLLSYVPEALLLLLLFVIDYEPISDHKTKPYVVLKNHLHEVRSRVLLGGLCCNEQLQVLTWVAVTRIDVIVKVSLPILVYENLLGFLRGSEHVVELACFVPCTEQLVFGFLCLRKSQLWPQWRRHTHRRGSLVGMSRLCEHNSVEIKWQSFWVPVFLVKFLIRALVELVIFGLMHVYFAQYLVLDTWPSSVNSAQKFL